MCITVISIISLAGIIVMLQRHISRRKIKERFCLVSSGRPVGKSCLIMTMQSCGPIIDKALECLSSNDNIEVCKNHRTGSQTIDIISDKVRDCSADTEGKIGKTSLYCEYMLEATDKIAETTRHLVTSPTVISRFHTNARLRQSVEELSGYLDWLTASSVLMTI